MGANKAFRFSSLRRDIGPSIRENVCGCKPDGAPVEAPFLVGYPAFSLLFDNNPHPMWIHDLTTLRFLAVNEAAIQTYMYSGDEFSTLTIDQIHPAGHKEQIQERMGDTCLASGAPRISRHIRKDGTVFDAELTSHNMMFGGRKARLVLAMDVTSREQAREAVLRQLQKMESTESLVGGLAQDFKSLLGVIVEFSEILAVRLKSDESLHGFAEETLKAGRQAATLTRQLLVFSRPQVLQPKILDFKGALTDIEQVLRPVIREDSSLLSKPFRELRHVRVDPGRAGQVI